MQIIYTGEVVHSLKIGIIIHIKLGVNRVNAYTDHLNVICVTGFRESLWGKCLVNVNNIYWRGSTLLNTYWRIEPFKCSLCDKGFTYIESFCKLQEAFASSKRRTGGLLLLLLWRRNQINRC